MCRVTFEKDRAPVKYVETMEEELMTSRRRHTMVVYSKMGVKRDGTLTALQHRVIADGGGYTAVGPLSMYLAGTITTLPYKLPKFSNMMLTACSQTILWGRQCAATGPLIPALPRKYMEMIAEQMGIDPVEMRIRNAIDNPPRGTIYRTINDVTLKTCGIKECINKVAAHPLWQERDNLPEKDNLSWGVGLSGTSYMGGARQMGHQACAAIVRICEDGTINLITGATDAGQGSDTVLSMIAAEELA